MQFDVSAKMLHEVAAKAIDHKSISCSYKPSSVLPDGTEIVHNNQGDIIFAHYSSGTRVIRYDTYVLVSSENGDHWFGDCQNRWFRLD